MSRKEQNKILTVAFRILFFLLYNKNKVNSLLIRLVPHYYLLANSWCVVLVVPFSRSARRIIEELLLDHFSGMLYIIVFCLLPPRRFRIDQMKNIGLISKVTMQIMA